MLPVVHVGDGVPASILGALGAVQIPAGLEWWKGLKECEKGGVKMG